MTGDGAATSFREHVCREAERIVEGFPAELRSEIYVVSFRIWRVDQDPRRPYVAIGYNTESEVLRVRERECPYEGSARWEYAYWLLEGFETLGHVPGDPVGSALHLEEAKAEGLWYDDEEAGSLPEEEIEERDDRLVSRFDEVCFEAARRLRTGGVLDRVFGGPLPVVVFDMDRPGWEVEATAAANPADVIAAFAEHQGGVADWTNRPRE
ncbi:hypothetical protein GCM10019016_029810 [Streptomyces prasinosporus]|uniref:DUF4303 domain-containing protein n=1 Tax=Streptomyces prasinosporus TaxID=68256 RepID=A0ABP6TKX2_9ACTN